MNFTGYVFNFGLRYMEDIEIVVYFVLPHASKFEIEF